VLLKPHSSCCSGKIRGLQVSLPSLVLEEGTRDHVQFKGRVFRLGQLISCMFCAIVYCSTVL